MKKKYAVIQQINRQSDSITVKCIRVNRRNTKLVDYLLTKIEENNGDGYENGDYRFSVVIPRYFVSEKTVDEMSRVFGSVEKIDKKLNTRKYPKISDYFDVEQYVDEELSL